MGYLFSSSNQCTIVVNRYCNFKEKWLSDYKHVVLVSEPNVNQHEHMSISADMSFSLHISICLKIGLLIVLKLTRED